MSTICKFVSFIFIISHIFPHNTYATHEIWQMRRGVGAIIIILRFMVTNMTMFVTTLYISRLDLLEELNFDYSEVNKTTDIGFSDYKFLLTNYYNSICIGNFFTALNKMLEYQNPKTNHTDQIILIQQNTCKPIS